MENSNQFEDVSPPTQMVIFQIIILVLGGVNGSILILFEVDTPSVFFFEGRMGYLKSR